MGNLSPHFNHKDFACHCPECKGEYRIHLGLVGALEMISDHFRKNVRIVSGFWCDAYHETLSRHKRSFHNRGKAVHFWVENVPLPEVFKFAETLPELRGLGFYPKENFIHADTRPGDPVRYVKEGLAYIPLTPDKRAKYGL